MNRSRTTLGAALLCCLASATASAQGQAPSPYVDVTTTHVPQAPDLHAVDATMIDVDRDGDLDVVVAVEHGANVLYLNDGNGKLTWKPGVFGDTPNDNEHVRAADFNGDGIMDVIFVAEADEVHNLFFGDGKGGFVPMNPRLPRTSQGNGLAVGDVNGDGLPDIVVGNTPEDKPGPARNFLWLNDSKRPGHFIDATATHLPASDDHTQGIALADMDGDADLDMVVANQSPPNRLLLNDGKGRFVDASDRLELPVPLETREVHVFDANRDGHPDIVFFNLTSNNGGWDKDPQTRLLINDGKGRFKDQTGKRLPAHRFSSWGGTVVDFNHDGAPDLLVSAIQVPGFVPLQVRAWQNDGRGNFEDVTLQAMPSATVGRGWSMAQGDLDGDRKPDIFIGGWRSQARLLLTDRAKVGAQKPAASPGQPCQSCPQK
ncbi:MULTISPECIES: VCBS repeat-containing protein [unclassified Xanthomonas]|uniref:FG-GAP repeat domain-containing protein n=1 Tax=unclassified Xanthomonas TaxID=2643310 RepID=UPI0021DF4FAA|nr:MULTISPECIES: VCBS repeat-containing protein [unclassified Xanthomonas]UYC20144.1 VCBS repeat-containing protein [Xanthomonas sp. CFBP 8443]